MFNTKSSSIPPDAAHLLPLLELISGAVHVIIDEYSAVNKSVPSLDSTTPGPFDTPESMTNELSKAILTVEAACAQLCFTVAPPGHIITNKVYAFEETAALQVVTEANIADILVDKRQGVHINDLSKDTGLDARKLGRILRMLATKHCFNEVQPNVFANNRLSMTLVSSDPVSSLIGHMSGECMKGSSYLNDALVDKTSGPSYSPADAPFRHAFGMPIFDFYGKEPKLADRFNKAMIGWGLVTGKAMLPKIYPWATLPKGTAICDVGGGNGHATLDLAKVFPQLHVVIQDLKHVVEEGTPLWTKEYPEAITNQQVEFVPLDFFKDSPVSGCDFYYLRHVLHDWSEAECLMILAKIRAVMKPSSKLLIHEFVLQHVVRDGLNKAQVTQAPEPLLPNWGMGRVRIYHQDINMMCSLNAKERTLQEFVDMGNKSGLKHVKVWDAGEAGVVEFVPV